MKCPSCGYQTDGRKSKCPACRTVVRKDLLDKELAKEQQAKAHAARTSSVSMQPRTTQTQPVPVAEANMFAIIGFIMAFLGFSFIGLILCIVGLIKAKKVYGGSGYGFALAGLIINIVMTVFMAIFIGFYIWFIIRMSMW
ncbi:MAG: hypothetical protein FWD89_00885 [Firmicutes bacterium]|nr:hypothetical protein [Bacillota bacterium]